MLKNRMIQVALLVIVFGGIFAVFTNQKNSTVQKEFLPIIETSNIQHIKIFKKDQPELLIKNSEALNRWTVSTKDQPDIVIDAKKIKQIFNFLNDSYVIQKVSKKESLYGKFDLSEDSTSIIEIALKSGDPITIYLGKVKSGTDQYVRKKSDPYVYLLSSNYQPDFDSKSWYYKKILNLPMENLNKVDYQTGKNKNISLNYERSLNKFDSTDPSPPEGKKLKNLDDIVRSFKNLTVKNFLDRKDSPQSKRKVSHKFYLKDGTILNLVFSKERKKKKEEDGDRFFLDFQLVESDQSSPFRNYFSMLSNAYLFEITSFDKARLNRDLSDFFEPIPKSEAVKKTKKKEKKKAETSKEK